MLELLILYSLNKQELTLYGLKKFISEYFGELSIPSHGALHPALKRLLEKQVINQRKKISDGGKRYTYYGINNKSIDFFIEKFTQISYSDSHTLEAFLYELKIRLSVSDIVENSLLATFKEKNILYLKKYLSKIEEKLKNPYLELSDNQKKVLEFYKNEIAQYEKLLGDLS